MATNAIGAAATRNDRRMALLLEAPVGRTLAVLSAPNIAVSLTQTAVTLADAWYLGQIGIAPLAAVALVFPVQALMVMMSAGSIGGGVSSAMSRALGAGKRDRADALLVHALIVAVVMAAIYTILFAVFSRPLFAALGGRAAALDGAVAYAEILFGGAIFVWLANTMASALRGTGNMIVPASVLIATALLDVFLSGALTLGWFGAPALGVRGPAVAFVAVHAIAFVLMCAYIVRGHAGIRLRLSGLAMKRDLFVDILKVGIVACGNALLTIATVVIVTALVGRYGTAALAGYGLGSRLELMLIPIAFGIGGAMTAMVGANRGRGNHARARRTAWAGGACVFVVTGAIGIAFAIWPSLWIDLFTSDPGAVSVARRYLHIAGPFYGFFGVGMALYFASQGTGNMIWPFTAGVARTAVAAGLGALAVHGFGLSLDWLFIFVAAGLFVFGTVIVASLRGRVWNPKQ